MTRILFIVFALWMCSSGVLARDYRAEVVRVIDGDTIVCNVDLGLGVQLRLQHIRLADVNAPELGTSEGKLARDKLREQLAGKAVMIHTVGITERDKYGRILARVTNLE